MRPLTYYVGTSLDGYIAGPGGEVDFFPVSEDHVQQMVETFPEVLPTHVRRHLGMDDAPNLRFDTVVMGRGTYQPALDIGITNPYAHLRTYVASTRGGLPEDAAVRVVRDPLTTVRELKAEDSPWGIWLAGGGRRLCAAEEIERLHDPDLRANRGVAGKTRWLITTFREDSMSFTERAAQFGFRHEAEFAKGYLDDAGIESFVVVDDAGGNLGLALENAATLMVRSTDLSRAREVLSEAGVLEDGEA